MSSRHGSIKNNETYEMETPLFILECQETFPAEHAQLRSNSTYAVCSMQMWMHIRDIKYPWNFQSFLLQICEWKWKLLLSLLQTEQHSCPHSHWLIHDPLAAFAFAFVFGFAFASAIEFFFNSLFCLTTPLEHIDFDIIDYWMSSIWSLWNISLEETHWCHIGYSFR